MKTLCNVTGCPTPVEWPGRYCDLHAEEVAAVRNDPDLLDADVLAELDGVSPILPWFLVASARNDPLTLPETVSSVLSDPHGWARTVQASRSVVTRRERWDPARARCDACRATANGVVRVPVAHRDHGEPVEARICEECYRLTDQVAYRSNRWWCPKCKARPDATFCLCEEEASPPEIQLGERLGGNERATPMAAAILLALTESDRPTAGLRVRTAGGRSVPIGGTTAIDDLEGARLAFVVAQVARRHDKDGSLGPGWRRRADAKDVLLPAEIAAAADDPATALIGRLHAIRALQVVLSEATGAQLRAVERLMAGERMTGADRNAKYHLKEKLKEMGLAP